MVSCIPHYFKAKELRKRDFIITLSIYYNRSFDEEIGGGLGHPPDGFVESEYEALHAYLPVKKRKR